jgi:hypothetical protein
MPGTSRKLGKGFVTSTWAAVLGATAVLQEAVMRKRAARRRGTKGLGTEGLGGWLPSTFLEMEWGVWVVILFSVIKYVYLEYYTILGECLQAV